MGDHVVVQLDRLIKPETVDATRENGHPESNPSVPSFSRVISGFDRDKEDHKVADEGEPLIQTVECRICQEEDQIKNLETPCACSGSLKYAHRTCVQRWCNEKGDIICEICHESYKSGYTVPPRVNPEETTIDISGGWTITGTPLDLHDPRLLAMAAAQRHLLEAEYDEYAATNASGAAFFRSAALILMALLLLRHALAITNGDDEDDASTIFSLFLLRAAGFLLPCYIMAWAISILQRRRQRQVGLPVQTWCWLLTWHDTFARSTCADYLYTSYLLFSVLAHYCPFSCLFTGMHCWPCQAVSQEAAALAATEVAFILQTGQGRGLHFTIAPESPTTPQQEPQE